MTDAIAEPTVQPYAFADNRGEGAIVTELAVFPGDVLRPVPTFKFDVPDGFEIGEAPGALAVAKWSEPVDGFTVNLVVSYDRVARGVNLEHAAATTLAQLRNQVPDVAVHQQKIGKFGTRATFLRAIELQIPKSDTVVGQVHALFFAPLLEATQTVDLFHMVGTCPKQVADKFGPLFIKMIASFQFT